MKLSTGTLVFAPQKNFGPARTEQAVSFPDEISRSHALLAGLECMYTARSGLGDGTIDEHEVQQIQVDLRAQELGPFAVEVSGAFGLKDNSGSWDDGFTGWARYVVIGAEGERTAQGNLDFPLANGTHPRSATESIALGQAESSVAALSGFAVQYPNNETWLQELVVDLRTQTPQPGRVDVTGSLTLEDKTPSDEFTGFIQFVGLGSDPGREGPQVRTGRLDFAVASGGPTEQRAIVDFGRPIGDCAAALVGFSIGFGQAGGDHPLHRARIEVEGRKLSDTQVEVLGHLALRDATGDWDDAYTGYINYCVIGT